MKLHIELGCEVEVLDSGYVSVSLNGCPISGMLTKAEREQIRMAYFLREKEIFDLAASKHEAADEDRR